MKIIEVAAKAPYPILIDNSFEKFHTQLNYSKETKFVIITDDVVQNHHLKELEFCLEQKGYQFYSEVIPHGEDSKSIATYAKLLDKLSEYHLTRQDVLIALGGGVVGDLTGFLAATYLRGIAFISVPTTLLSMVDSSVGGKTAINTTFGKNLCGAFKTPDFVYINPKTLETLDDVYFREGLAEVIKYAFLGKKELLDLLLVEKIEKYSSNLREIIRHSLAKKIELVSKDEFEKNERKLLNFGHTFAHGIEKGTNYAYRHGQAVAIGMYLIVKASVYLGLTEDEVLRCLVKVLDKQALSYVIPVSKDTLLYYASFDKKRLGEVVDLVLVNTDGGFLYPISILELEKFLVGVEDENSSKIING